MEDPSEAPTTRRYRIVAAVSYAVSTAAICGVVFGKLREGGIFADEYLWMKYQTLITPADYTIYQWIPIILLHSLYLHASLTATSPLIGLPPSLIAPSTWHSPLLLLVAITIYSHDSGKILLATIMSLLSAGMAGLVSVLQLKALSLKDEEGGEEINPMSMAYAREYVSLRLPFELLGGTMLGMTLVYFNTWLHILGLSPKVKVILANFTLICLLLLASLLLWSLKIGNGRHLYGIPLSLLWILVGIATELQSPTQPIYNEYSDQQILTTQVLAALSSTLLSSVMVIRGVKTMIKRNMFQCCQGRVDEDGVEGLGVDDHDIASGYVHA